MDAARKQMELANLVRHNAENVKTVMHELYNWEKEIKDKEKQSAQQMDNKESNLPPVRSLRKDLPTQPTGAVAKQQQNTSKQEVCNGVATSPLESPTEKRDTALDPMELRHKEANEIKDRGNRFVKLADYTKAINEYTMAIEMFAEDAVYYANRALCYLKMERYDLCIEDCDRATEIDSLAVKAYYRRMQANESLGNNMDALKDCTTVLMIEPKNIEAKRSLERINERLRKNVKMNAANFTNLNSNLIDILPIEKPAYKRSTKPLKRVPIADVVGPKDCKNQENLKISDEDIDKLFNSSCRYFEEIKDPEEILKLKKQNSVESNKEMLNNKKNIPAAAAAATAVTSTDLHNASEKFNTKSEPNLKNTTKSIAVAAAAATTKEQQNVENQKEFTTKEDTNKKATVEEIKSERPIPPAPKSTGQFYANWKELTQAQKYEYLKSIQIPNLCRVLGAGFDSDTLTDVIRTLRDYYLPQKNSSELASTLLEISKNKQVPILSLLMSTEERKALSQMINYLKENPKKDEKIATTAEQIMKNFNLI